MFKFLEKLLGYGNGDEITELLQNGAIVVDVRTAFEYNSGYVEGSVNIPLDDLGQQIKKLRAANVPIITCCQSGRRSGIAESTLRARGIEAHNGGSWGRVQKLVNRQFKN
jgi:rhodanese-related sulfurtransferase